MHLNKKRAFTLIELLVVMAIIFILVGLISVIIPYVNKKNARAAAEGQIHGMIVALEAYKADNGAYPNDGPIVTGASSSYAKGATDKLDARTNGDPTDSAGPTGGYIQAGLVLYRALSGDTNLDRSVNASDMQTDISGQSTSNQAAPPATYYTFTSGQVLPAGGKGTVTQIVDPFGYSYGYSTAYAGDIATNNSTSGTTAPTHGYNPTFDLWSTAGTVASKNDVAAQTAAKRAQWIYNWQNSGANAGQ